MADFNFRNELTEFPFVMGNTYSYSKEPTNILLLNPKYVPIVKLKGDFPEQKTPLDVLEVCGRQFRGRALTRDKTFEVLRTAHYPLLVKIATFDYYIGKGFIGKKLPDGKVEPIMVMTVPGIDYIDNDPADITLIVANGYVSETSIIKSIVQQCLREAEGDTFYTNHIQKFLAGKIKIPRFRNIREKKEFTEKFIDDLIAAL